MLFRSVYAQGGDELTPEQQAIADSTEKADAEAQAVADKKAADEKAAAEAEAANAEAEVVEDKSFTQVIKQKFIEGGPGFMGIVLVCLILGLAIVIERIIYLNMATTNTEKLLGNIEEEIGRAHV